MMLLDATRLLESRCLIRPTLLAPVTEAANTTTARDSTNTNHTTWVVFRHVMTCHAFLVTLSMLPSHVHVRMSR